MPFEWLIDLIKEWVIAQAYATEAWVLEWVTPLHVSGTLDPDSTCTYHKAGTLNGQPYYIRNDGAYYIWWNGVVYWFISEELGVAAQPLWGRLDPNVLGNYAPVAPTIGTATAASGYGCLHRCFVDRGDPAAADFGVGDFIKDATWRDLDLSDIVPAGAKVVCVSFIIRANAADLWAGLRRKGNVNIWNVSWLSTPAAGIHSMNDITCPLDANRHIQYYFQVGVWTPIWFTVKGWWY